MNLHITTPLIPWLPLKSTSDSDVALKLECLQPTGSFKIRGVGKACWLGYSNGARSFVTSSGGNAGMAVAYAGARLDVATTIVVPETTSKEMLGHLRRLGPTVVQYGAAWDDSHARALEIAEREGALYIHPFDDPRVWSGHSSMVHEVKASGFIPDLVVAAVGGGGLLCGLLRGLHEVGWPHVPVMAVETEGADSFARAVDAGKLVSLPQVTSIANSLGAKTVCEEALKWTKAHKVIPHTVTDRSAVAAVSRFADDHRILVEPACGAALSVLYGNVLASEYNRVLTIVCGGVGVTRQLLDRWIERFQLSASS